jgi:hypothetical protein
MRKTRSNTASLAGPWGNAGMLTCCDCGGTVPRAEDRTLTARLGDGEEHSQLSVDADGRLCANLMGSAPSSPMSR